MGPVILTGILKLLDSYSSSDSGVMHTELFWFPCLIYIKALWLESDWFNLLHISIEIDFVYFIPDAIARDTKTFSFQAIGLLGQRLPHLFRCFVHLLLSASLYPYCDNNLVAISFHFQRQDRYGCSSFWCIENWVRISSFCYPRSNQFSCGCIQGMLGFTLLNYNFFSSCQRKILLPEVSLSACNS